MTALTTEEFITWANRLANLPWPMTTKEFATIATREFGWTIFDSEQGGLFTDGASTSETPNQSALEDGCE